MGMMTKGVIVNCVRKTVLPSVLAGILIGLGCAVNARVGGLEGAVLFATGLVTIIFFRLPLFTGIVANKPSWDMAAILLGNVAGAVLAHYWFAIDTMPPVTMSAINVFFGACGTGILMVGAYKSKNMLIAVMGVTLFITSGFHHCIAEAGYLRMTAVQWIAALLGNIVGGQVYRMKNDEEKTGGEEK